MPAGDFTDRFCNAQCPEQCCYRLELIKSPADMPMNDIVAIMAENIRLKKEVEHWKTRATDCWEIVESVATGERLQCGKCHHYHPCRCDDGQ